MSTTACMYLGPSRPFGLPLMRNAILRGKPEEVFPVLADLFEEHPELRTLFVPVHGAHAADHARDSHVSGVCRRPGCVRQARKK